jgi:hypothetical protein
VSSGNIVDMGEELYNLYLDLCERLEKIDPESFQRPYKSLFEKGRKIDVWKEGGPRDRLLDYLFMNKRSSGKDINLIDKVSKEDKYLLNEAYFSLKLYEDYKSELEKGFKEELKKIANRNRAIDWQKYCRLENGAFSIRLADGSWTHIDFSVNKTNAMFEVLKVMFKKWRKNIDKNTVIVTKPEFTSHLSKVIDNYSENKLRSHISNLKKKKIEARGLENIVVISNFIIKDNGYSFSIKLPIRT